MKRVWKEFKEFAIKGNAVDLAVGVIIGAAFGSIVSSLVKDIIMPPISLLTGGLDFSNKFVVLRAAKDGATAFNMRAAATDCFPARQQPVLIANLRREPLFPPDDNDR